MMLTSRAARLFCSTISPSSGSTLGDELEAAGFFRREGELDRLDARLQRDRLLADLDFHRAFAGRFAARACGPSRVT